MNFYSPRGADSGDMYIFVLGVMIQCEINFGHAMSGNPLNDLIPDDNFSFRDILSKSSIETTR